MKRQPAGSAVGGQFASGDAARDEADVELGADKPLQEQMSDLHERLNDPQEDSASITRQINALQRTIHHRAIGFLKYRLGYSHWETSIHEAMDRPTVMALKGWMAGRNNVRTLQAKVDDDGAVTSMWVPGVRRVKRTPSKIDLVSPDGSSSGRDFAGVVCVASTEDVWVGHDKSMDTYIIYENVPNGAEMLPDRYDVRYRPVHSGDFDMRSFDVETPHGVIAEVTTYRNNPGVAHIIPRRGSNQELGRFRNEVAGRSFTVRN